MVAGNETTFCSEDTTGNIQPTLTCSAFTFHPHTIIVYSMINASRLQLKAPSFRMGL